MNQSVMSVVSNLFTTQLHASPWNLISDWVIAPVNSYLQKINIEQTNSNDSITLITMSSSVMPYHDNPYVTISIKNL